MKILVVGGAGYIGSHMVKLLARRGHSPVTFDDLSTGERAAVVAGEFELGSLGDRARLAGVFESCAFDAVIHFAASVQVGESVTAPGKYYRNNICGTLNLLDAMLAAGVKQLVFSSSAAVYGEPQTDLIDESHPKNPVNPYGRTKWMVEQILEDYSAAHGLRPVALRYFNAAGADPEGELGPRHEPATHLIPVVLQAACGRRPFVEVCGNDYPTADGTGVRDYIHVWDLCEAHLAALEHLAQGGEGGPFNLGNGVGFSVMGVIKTAERVTGRSITRQVAARRAGDPAQIVADATRATKVLNWQPQFGDLATIIRHAWTWEQSRMRSGPKSGSC